MQHSPLHATSVAFDGAAVLICGKAGAGKSSLALDLISRGALLVSDDRTVLHDKDGHLIAAAPPTITGMIEARGVGLLRVPTAGPTPIRFAIDLDQTETQRLPPRRTMPLMGHDLPCLWRVAGPQFPAAVLLCLAHGIPEPT